MLGNKDCIMTAKSTKFDRLVEKIYVKKKKICKFA